MSQAGSKPDFLIKKKLIDCDQTDRPYVVYYQQSSIQRGHVDLSSRDEVARRVASIVAGLAIIIVVAHCPTSRGLILIDDKKNLLLHHEM